MRYLWETALVIQNPQYPMGLSGNEVNAGLVVTERDVLPGDLFPVVLLLHGDHMTSKFPLSSVDNSASIA